MPLLLYETKAADHKSFETFGPFPHRRIHTFAYTMYILLPTPGIVQQITNWQITHGSFCTPENMLHFFISLFIAKKHTQTLTPKVYMFRVCVWVWVWVNICGNTWIWIFYGVKCSKISRCDFYVYSKLSIIHGREEGDNPKTTLFNLCDASIDMLQAKGNGVEWWEYFRELFRYMRHQL